MPELLQQRCFWHRRREAVARCLACNRFFCRECVTEHHDRVLCSDCLEKLSQSRQDRQAKTAVFWRAAQICCGALVLWLVFYLVGHLLLSIPSAFHEGTVWKSTWWGN